MKTEIENSQTEEAAELAINGGDKAVSAPPPVNGFHGVNEIGEEEIRAVTEVLRGKQIFRFMKDKALSPVDQLEKDFSTRLGVRHALAVNSGTSALIAGLVGIGVSQGDEVLVPSYTYIATGCAVMALGAIPVVVEIDDSMMMEPKDIANKVTSRTTAVIPVHMRGKSCNMEAIMAEARRLGLKVLEDCAQAMGGTYRGRAHGLAGDAGAYSMQQYKVITAGEGGVVVANDTTVFERAAIYHDCAYAFWMENQPDSFTIETPIYVGENYRQSEVHGAIGVEQLKKLDGILKRTRSIRFKIREVLEKLPGAQVETSNDEEGDCGISIGFHMESRDEALRVAEILRAEGVPFGSVFSKQIPNRHIYYHWDFLMEKRTPHANGFPWNGARDQEYTREMCPQTLDLLERNSVMSINQIMSDEFVDQCCRGIEKVSRYL
jgi:dTDP-4-amino-4,6-dideoxygalactose transaminase